MVLYIDLSPKSVQSSTLMTLSDAAVNRTVQLRRTESTFLKNWTSLYFLCGSKSWPYSQSRDSFYTIFRNETAYLWQSQSSRTCTSFTAFCKTVQNVPKSLIEVKYIWKNVRRVWIWPTRKLDFLLLSGFWSSARVLVASSRQIKLIWNSRFHRTLFIPSNII